MGWRILYIEESNSLNLYLDNIKVTNGANNFTFPIEDILLIIVDNYKTTLSANLMINCSKANVPIVLCGDNHHPLNIVIPLFGNYEGTKILFKQIKWSDEQKNKIWQIIIKQKLTNQYEALKICKNDAFDALTLLQKYINEVKYGDETNREGLAAKVYFRALFGNNFTRNDESVVNACLNYGYSIIRALISKIIISKGLNPQLGIFHKNPTNFFNLADDLIEIFRPVVDIFVFINFKNEKIFKREHRIKILTILDGKLLLNGQKQTLNHCIEMMTDELIRYFDSGSLTNFVNFNPNIYDV